MYTTFSQPKILYHNLVNRLDVHTWVIIVGHICAPFICTIKWVPWRELSDSHRWHKEAPAGKSFSVHVYFETFPWFRAMQNVTWGLNLNKIGNDFCLLVLLLEVRNDNGNKILSISHGTRVLSGRFHLKMPHLFYVSGFAIFSYQLKRIWWIL